MSFDIYIHSRKHCNNKIQNIFTIPQNLLMLLYSLSLLPPLSPGGNHQSAFCHYSFICIFKNCMSWDYTVHSILVWFLSVSIIFLRFIYVVACISSLFLCIAEWYFQCNKYVMFNSFTW